jgi:hypothetical protein
MIKRKKVIPVDKKFSNLASKYELHITEVRIDKIAIRVRYKLTPAITTVENQMGIAPIIDWWGYARDNTGGDYQSAGGARGQSPDGTYTEGVLSFVPVPGEWVKTIEITIIATEGNGKETKCEFTISVT